MRLRDQLDAARSSWWLRECEGPRQRPHLRGRPCIDVYGGTIRIGSGGSIASRPVTSHFVAGPGATLEIGDDVWFGHGAAVAAFERVQIGSGTRIGPFIIIMDTNFHGASGDQSVHHECRPVIIGRGCRIGSRVTITRGVTIGDGAEILAGSVVSSSVPPGACAAGARARVLGRAGDRTTRWDGAAAMAPLGIADSFGLPSIPEAETPLTDIPGWDVQGVERFVTQLERSCSIRIAAPELMGCRTVGDVIMAMDRARPDRLSGGNSRGN